MGAAHAPLKAPWKRGRPSQDSLPGFHLEHPEGRGCPSLCGEEQGPRAGLGSIPDTSSEAAGEADVNPELRGEGPEMVFTAARDHKGGSGAQKK